MTEAQGVEIVRELNNIYTVNPYDREVCKKTIAFIKSLTSDLMEAERIADEFGKVTPQQYQKEIAALTSERDEARKVAFPGDREAIARIINPDAFEKSPDPDEPEFWRKAARVLALAKADAILALDPAASQGVSELADEESVADAIDNARYHHPIYPRERPRPFSEAGQSDREYALRLARAALRSASPAADTISRSSAGNARGPDDKIYADYAKLNGEMADMEARAILAEAELAALRSKESGEPIAYTTQGQIDGLKNGGTSIAFGKPDDVWRVPLFSAPPVAATVDDYRRRAEAAEAQLAEAVKLMDSLLGLELGSGSAAQAFVEGYNGAIASPADGGR